MKSSSRNGATVVWLVLHTTEGIMRATDLRAWTAWPGSSHAACDETGMLLTPAEGFVPYDRAAWTLRNGNAISENIEQCGFARWTRADWLARPKLLDATARWLADRSRARGIPLRRLSHAEVRARNVPGVIMHDDYSKATGDGSHWDCGPGYPWDVVLARANDYRNGLNPQEDDDMNSDQVKLLQEVHNMAALLISVAERPLDAEKRLSLRLDALGELVRQLAVQQGSPIDMGAVEAVVEKGVADAIAAIDTTVTVRPAD